MAKNPKRAKQLDKDIASGQRRISTIARTGNRAIAGTVEEFTKKRNFMTNAGTRNRLYAELAAEYRVLNSNVNDWVRSEVDVTAKNFFNYAKEDLPKGSVSGTFGSFSDKYVEDIIGLINPATVGKQVAINAQLGGMLTQDIRALRAAVSTTIAEGAVEGLTNAQMASRMQAKVSKAVGKFQFVDKAGRRQTADTYFGTLNRTLHATTARESYIDASTKEAGFDLYMIDGGVTGSSADNPEDPCDQWANRVVSMTGNTQGYDTYADAVAAGVFHPNCVHFVRVVMKSEAEAIKGAK